MTLLMMEDDERNVLDSYELWKIDDMNESMDNVQNHVTKEEMRLLEEQDHECNQIDHHSDAMNRKLEIERIKYPDAIETKASELILKEKLDLLIDKIMGNLDLKGEMKEYV